MRPRHAPSSPTAPRPNPSNGPPTEAESEAQAGEPARPVNRRLLAAQIALLVVATGASLAAIPFASQIRAFPGPAYVVLFVLSIQSGALFMVPGFGWAAIAAYAVAFGDIWGPVLIGTTGQVIGEMVSYLLGATSSPWIRRQRAYRRVERWIQRWGLMAVLVISAVPNPLFDIAGAIAGAAGLGWRRFFVAAWVGRLLKNMGFALAGLQGAELIEMLLQ